jgi:hypothetical protein
MFETYVTEGRYHYLEYYLEHLKPRCPVEYVTWQQE